MSARALAWLNEVAPRWSGCAYAYGKALASLRDGFGLANPDMRRGRTSFRRTYGRGVMGYFNMGHRRCVLLNEVRRNADIPQSSCYEHYSGAHSSVVSGVCKRLCSPRRRCCAEAHTHSTGMFAKRWLTSSNRLLRTRTWIHAGARAGWPRICNATRHWRGSRTTEQPRLSVLAAPVSNDLRGWRDRSRWAPSDTSPAVNAVCVVRVQGPARLALRPTRHLHADADFIRLHHGV